MVPGSEARVACRQPVNAERTPLARMLPSVMGGADVAFDHRPRRFSGDKQYAPDALQFAGHCRTFRIASRVVPGIGAQYIAPLA